MQTVDTEMVLTLRQKGIGERLERIVQRLDVRAIMHTAVELWTTSEPCRDRHGRPLRPFPVDKDRDPNSDRENVVLLAAAYQCLSRAGEPILPAPFMLEEHPTRAQWHMFIEAIGKLDASDLSYVDEILNAFATKHAPADENVTADSVNLSPRPDATVEMDNVVPTNLSQRQLHILQAMSELKALDSDSRQPTTAIAKRTEGPEANAENFKQPIAELVKMKLVKSKYGRGGGCWLSDTGKARAKKLVASAT